MILPPNSTASIIESHPEHTLRLPDWTLCSDAYEGERAIKSRGTTYLPPTSGMIADGVFRGGEPGLAAYSAYVARAVFPGFFREAVATLEGTLNHRPDIVELPKALEPMRERATLRGEDLDSLLRQIHRGVLTTGRVPILLDVHTGASASSLPYVCLYDGRQLVNWRLGYGPEGERLEMAVFDEGTYREGKMLSGYSWVNSYRTLRVTDGKYEVAVDERFPPSDEMFMVPTLAGRTLEAIPLVVCNATRLGAGCPEVPPLLALAQLCLAIYRGEADYRHSLFATTQETLVRTGVSQQDADQQTRVGAGAILDVPLNGDAKYIGISGAGLEQQRLALEADRRRAALMGAQLLDKRGADEASAEAVRLQLGARTATLTSIAHTSAEALAAILRHAAIFVGADPAQVIVEPNLDFVDEEPPMAALRDLMTAKNLGAPISLRSVHAWMREREITSEEFDDELDLIAEEKTTLGQDGAADNDLDPAVGEDDDDERGEYPQ
jgi:hypothetical protein